MPQILTIALAALSGLLIGSFLNVVIYRLPKMLKKQWARECAQFSGAPAVGSDTFNLLTPRSHCPSCGQAVAWHHNVPVLSYLVLKGRCAHCRTPIGLRYVVVELATAALFAFCASRWGVSTTAVAWCFFSSSLLVLALIDWDTTLLPDDITLPLLWGGLLVAALDLNPWVKLEMAMWGAVAGYLVLWTVYWVFKLVTGKEGMGYGDFKLLAALGAWLGWMVLPAIILIASLVGAIVGIGMKMTCGLREGGQIPFGPFLVGAGFIVLFFTPAVVLSWLIF